MDYENQGDIKVDGSDSEDSSEQGSIDVDGNGNLLSSPWKDIAHDYALISLDEVDKNIVSYAIMGIDVTEFVSPAMITHVCSTFRLVPGDAFDPLSGWDLSKPEDQAEVTRIVLRDKPTLVVGSPPHAR